jgi:putative tricarboxylic transport membrane protein
VYRRDLFACFVWLGTSIYICYLSLGLGFGKFGTPGAGFFPFWAGVLMGVFALLHLANVYTKKENTEASGSSIGKKSKKTLFVVVSLLLYPLFLPTLGYLIATFILMGFLFLILGEARRFWLKGLTALFVTFATFFVFYVLLDVRLPVGVFGF